MAHELQFLTGTRRVRFEALRDDLVPRARELSPAQREAGLGIVDRLVAGMPADRQRKLGVFLVLIDILAFLRGLRPFRRLHPDRRQRLLAWLFDAPVGLLRKGFWGLNSLANMSVYGLPELYDDFAYRPRPHGPTTRTEDA